MITPVAEDQVYVTAVPDGTPSVRAAREADVDAITKIVNENARQGHLLPRSAENIRASLDTWLVAELGGVVVGIGSLLEMSPALVEVRSLAVLPAYRRYGVGAHIVQALVERARERGVVLPAAWLQDQRPRPLSRESLARLRGLPAPARLR
jgi:amino-acid N-acetyltransferase